MGYCEKE